MVQLLIPNNDAIFQDDNSPKHTEVFGLSLEYAFERLPWPAQSPDLNIIEPLPSVLESTVRGRFLSPSSLTQLEDVLHEGWYNSPLRDYSEPT